MLKQALYFLAFIIVLLSAFVAIERASSPFFQSCISENELSGQNASVEKNLTNVGTIISTYIRCSGRFIEGHGVGITALASVIVAAFTGTLWLATDKLWRSGQATFEASQRAFVFIDGFNFELTTRADVKGALDASYEAEPQWHQHHPELVITRFAIQPRWKNGGNTPTSNMTIQVDWRGPPGPVPPVEYTYRNSPQAFFLPPKAVEVGAVVEIPSAAAVVNWAMSPMGAEPFILIWGRADYEDVFCRKHFVEWCYRLRLSRTGGKKMSAECIQWGDYNRSDKNA
jgi:hypothetical protein